MEEIKIQATLSLGANVQGTYEVTADRFRAWLADHVTPIFAGFTVRTDDGYWEDQAEMSRELVIVNTAMPDCEFKNAITLIAASYRSRFNQDAVLVTYSPVTVQFVSRPHVEPVA